MNAVGQTIVIGLISGAIYSLFAIGVVLVYRGTGAINFAQGEVGTASLFVAWWLVTDNGLPWIIGAVAALAFAAAVGIGFERLIIRPMVKANRVSVTVATVGLLSLVLSSELKMFSPSPRVLDAPIDGLGIQVFGIFVSPTQILSLLLVGVIVAGLSLLLRRTDFGLGVLAAAQDPDGARLMGVPLNRVSMFVWGTATTLSALGALLIEPSIGAFAPGFASRLFLFGLAAAVLGGLTSIEGAVVGGIAVGIAEAAISRVFGGANIPGVTTLAIFALILAVLVLRPSGLLGSVRTRGAAA